MKIFRLILSLLLVVASTFLCVRIVQDAKQNKLSKIDLAELNDIKYGLLSIEEWKARITEILTSEIDRLDLKGLDQKEVCDHIESVLNTMIDKVAKNIKQENSGTLTGKIKQSFIDAFVSIDDIKKGIPEYTTAIMKEMTSAKSTSQVKTALHGQMAKYSTEIKDDIDKSRREEIVSATQAKDPAEAKEKLRRAVQETNDRIARNAWIFIGLSVFLFALVGFTDRPLSTGSYVFLALNLVLLLAAGVTTPMIDLEAKISRMSMSLLGHPLSFENQILYFQSKSILDVFLIMMADPGFQMKAVGVLMVAFSIVFPVLKLISSGFYFSNWKESRENPVIKFFVLKSGKWSMADVTVVAIFMAYIGFNGIVDSKLDDLATAGEGPALLTTNGTALQPGYFLFFAFAVLAQFLSEFLAKERFESRDREGHAHPGGVLVIDGDVEGTALDQ